MESDSWTSRQIEGKEVLCPQNHPKFGFYKEKGKIGIVDIETSTFTEPFLDDVHTENYEFETWIANYVVGEINGNFYLVDCEGNCYFETNKPFIICRNVFVSGDRSCFFAKDKDGNLKRHTAQKNSQELEVFSSKRFPAKFAYVKDNSEKNHHIGIISCLGDVWYVWYLFNIDELLDSFWCNLYFNWRVCGYATNQFYLEKSWTIDTDFRMIGLITATFEHNGYMIVRLDNGEFYELIRHKYVDRYWQKNGVSFIEYKDGERIVRLPKTTIITGEEPEWIDKAQGLVVYRVGRIIKVLDLEGKIIEEKELDAEKLYYGLLYEKILTKEKS